MKQIVFAFGFVGIVAGCGTVSVPVEIQRPAKYPLTKYKQVAVGMFEGENADQVRDAIQQALFQRNFEVLDREKAAEIEREGSRNAKAGAVIRGRVTRWGCSDPPPKAIEGGGAYNAEGKMVQTFKKVTQGQVYVTIRVTDASTKLVAPPTNYQGIKTVEETGVPGDFTQQDPEGLIAMALQEVVQQFIKDALPYTETRNVTFFTSGEIPELEQGINAAKSRNWEGAILSFTVATQRTPAPGAAELAKAFYNLGTAQMYSGSFTEARAALQKSTGLGLKEANEQLGALAQRESEEKKLQQQLQ